MDKNSIDQFFDSISKEELSKKWATYDKYSQQENTVTVNELISAWNSYYDNTFELRDFSYKDYVI